MTTEEIKVATDKIKASSGRFNSQKAYHQGNNVGILQPEAKPNPDVRAPIPFARKAVSLIKGYMAKPGNISYSGDYYNSTLKSIFDENDEELTTSDELEDCLIHGVCYELHWITDGVKQFYPVPVSQGLPIFSDDLKPVLEGFVWYRMGSDDAELATYYDAQVVQEFFKPKKGSWTTQGDYPHGYGQVPVNVGRIDREYRNIFDHCIPLIDLYDRLISEDVGNELERFNAAILAMAERIDATSTDDSGRTMIDRLKELRVIDGLGEGNVRDKIGFITRDIPTAFIEFAAGQVERLIYEMLMIVNPNDDNFAAASGVAQAYKLLAMEYLCAGIEAYFSRFLQKRIQLIAGISGELGDVTDGANEVTIAFHRNLPHNLAETAETMAKLKGQISDRTLIGLLPKSIVPDVDDELAAMADTVQDVMDEPEVPEEVVQDDDSDQV